MAHAIDPHETLENAHHGAHATDNFTLRASVSIAIMAVVAATIGGFEASASNNAVLAKSQANLAQNKATDTWAFFQANSIKKNMYLLAAEGAPPDRAEGYTKKSKDYESRETNIEKEARALDKKVEEHDHESDHHTHIHHGLTIAGTAEHVGIAIASVAMISRSKLMWYGAMTLGVLGAVYAAATLIPMH